MEIEKSLNYSELDKYLKNDFSRDLESAADFFGHLYVRRAGFNVQEGIKIFERQGENGRIAFYKDHFGTHPSSLTRYQTLVSQAKEIANAEIEKLHKAEEEKMGLEARYVGIVTRTYKDILKREPDQGGLQYHVNQMKNGMNELQLRQVFLISEEYKGKFIYPEIVKKLYMNILRQQPNQDKLTYYVDRMKGGWSEQQVRNDLERIKNAAIAEQETKREDQLKKELAEKQKAGEERKRLEEEKKKELEARYVGIVTRTYKDILKRDPDPGGLQTYVDFMKKGWSEQKVRNTLLDSQEYKQMIAKEALQNQKSIQVGDTVTVANTGGIGLLLRSSPGLKYPKITNLPDGTRMKVIGGPVQADGYIWWRLQGNPGTGWSVGNWLAP